MAQWVRLCGVEEAPQPGKVMRLEAHGVDVCLANVNGTLSALDNWCPHRRGPLGEGWVEGDRVVCPWHAWGFEVATGNCPEEHAHVDVFPLKTEGGDVLVDIT
jgi:nitrite reductase (NADH) small subunit